MITSLNHIVKLYVPGTVNVNQLDPVAQAKYTDIALTELAGMFGGATVQPAIGAWVSQSAGLVKEPVNIVGAYCTEEGLHNNRDNVVQLATRLAKEMGQEAVSLEIDGELLFVTAEQRQAA